MEIQIKLFIYTKNYFKYLPLMRHLSKKNNKYQMVYLLYPETQFLAVKVAKKVFFLLIINLHLIYLTYKANLLHNKLILHVILLLVLVQFHNHMTFLKKFR